MNKKGFAISVILYSIVFLLVSILYMITALLRTRYHVSSDLRDAIIEQLDEDVNGINAAEYISGMRILEELGNAKRYVGTDPNNYIKFNNEKWRIIGVYGDKLKIVKATPSSSQAFSSVSGNGNVWSNISLSSYLNSTYYQTLTDDAKMMIDENSSWYVGKIAYNISANTAYTGAQATTWIGKVGLVSAYEYLYAAGSACQDALGNTEFDTTCNENDWMWMALTNNKAKDAWTMSPNIAAGSDAIRVMKSSGKINFHDVVNSVNISPVVYLKSTVKITGGNGQIDNEYILKYKES